jgi:hypothetical protein
MNRSDTGNHDIKRSENVAVEPLRQGFRVEFSDLLRVLYGGSEENGADVQHVILGALHADDRDLLAKLGSDEVMKSLAESAVTKLFLEYPKDRQEIVSKFTDAVKCGEDTFRPEDTSFAEEFREGNYKSPRVDQDDWWVNGAHQFVQGREFFNGKTLKFVNECLAPLLAKAKCGDIDAYMVDDPYSARDKIEEYRVKVEEYKRAVAAGDDGKDAIYSEVKKLGREFLLMRHADKPIASFIESTAGDEKSLSFLGILHGSLAMDLNELLEDDEGKNRRVVKMNIAKNFESYKDDYGIQQLRNKVHSFVPEFGEDPPNLVYLVEEGVCLTTKNTPQYVKDAFEAKGIELVPMEQLCSQNMVEKQTLIAQEIETKDLSLDAFV